MWQDMPGSNLYCKQLHCSISMHAFVILLKPESRTITSQQLHSGGFREEARGIAPPSGNLKEYRTLNVLI